jgi:hypothetical protein
MAAGDRVQDWQAVTQLTGGQAFTVERIRLAKTGIAIEGAFELPELARIPVEDQVFITAFVRAHGSIKEMERVFGVSYPTIKARLNRIAGQLSFVETNPASSREEVLARLERGEISAEEAVHALRANRG